MDVTPWSAQHLPDGEYQRFRKEYRPLAIRITGPFSCLTGEGNVASCEDGWLAIDSQGHPYPIGAAEFESTYFLDDGEG
jgi:hypothetical protein